MTTDTTNHHPDTELEVEADIDGPAGIDDIGEIDEIDDEGDDMDDEVDIDELEAVDSDDADLDDDDEVLAIDPVVEPSTAAAVPAAAPALVDSDPDDDVLIVDEVEASLDIILAERMRSGDADNDADDDLDEDDDTPSQLATVIPVRRPDEFLCQSCFLLKPPGQLADIDHQLCRDCA